MNNFIEDNFTTIKFNKFEVLFSNKNIDFKIDNNDTHLNLERLKEALKVRDLGFLRQTHSDIIIDYNGTITEGDSIITNNKDVALLVFTADCVPILLWDKEKDVIAAVHSGWKGTEKNILGKTIDKMVKDYNCKIENIFSFIGPHIQKCCYEVSEELIQLFKKNHLNKDVSINEGRYLDLNACILAILNDKGIQEEHIYNTNICTCCDSEVGFHSYRREQENSGRIISVITFK